MCLGVPQEDMVILLSAKKASKLLKTPGLYASDSGNELFRKANLKEFLGVPLYVTNALPAGTNFVLMTTGTHGAIGYEQVGDVSEKTIGGVKMSVLEGNATMVPNPNWSQYYRIDCIDVFKLGIIFADLIIVSSENVSVAGASSRKANKADTFDVNQGHYNRTDLEKLISLDNTEIKSYQDQKANIQDKIDAEDKKGDKADKDTIKEYGKQIKDLNKKIEEATEHKERFEKALNALEESKSKK